MTEPAEPDEATDSPYARDPETAPDDGWCEDRDDPAAEGDDG